MPLIPPSSVVFPSSISRFLWSSLPLFLLILLLLQVSFCYFQALSLFFFPPHSPHCFIDLLTRSSRATMSHFSQIFSHWLLPVSCWPHLLIWEGIFHTSNFKPTTEHPNRLFFHILDSLSFSAIVGHNAPNILTGLQKCALAYWSMEKDSEYTHYIFFILYSLWGYNFLWMEVNSIKAWWNSGTFDLKFYTGTLKNYMQNVLKSVS